MHANRQSISNQASAVILIKQFLRMSSTDFTIKAGLAKMLKGGVIMDVVNDAGNGFGAHSR
jgi:alanine dehydrogenase